MDRRNDEEHATFVLRLSRPKRAKSWRGEVEHVQTGERRGVAGLAAFARELRALLRDRPAHRTEEDE